MANENPTGGTRPVSLDLAANTSRSCSLIGWLQGAREDLETPERLKRPDELRQEAHAYERLLLALNTGTISLPDEAARAAVEAATAGDHEASNYREIAANHDALHGEARALGRLRLHQARHTYASFMIAAGVNAKALSSFMGHSSIKVTFDLYGHLMPGTEAKAAALLDTFLGFQVRDGEEAARSAMVST
jgi:Phage integrase family